MKRKRNIGKVLMFRTILSISYMITILFIEFWLGESWFLRLKGCVSAGHYLPNRTTRNDYQRYQKSKKFLAYYDFANYLKNMNWNNFFHKLQMDISTNFIPGNKFYFKITTITLKIGVKVSVSPYAAYRIMLEIVFLYCLSRNTTM